MNEKRLSFNTQPIVYEEIFLQAFNSQLTFSAFNEYQNNPKQQTTRRKLHSVATKQPYAQRGKLNFKEKNKQYR